MFSLFENSNQLTVFLEPYYIGQRKGWVEVICGCMFSGKTEELIRRLKRSKIGGQKVKVVKSGRDIRYDDDNVVSHDKNSLEAIPIKKSTDLRDFVGEVDVLGIDEAQFFDEDLQETIEYLANNGVRVIVAGLDMDYKGKPFYPMPDIMATAEFITKVHAICVHCGNLATHSYRLTEDEQKVLVGERNAYEARCRKCFNMGAILNFKSENEKDLQHESQTLFPEEE